MLSNAVTNLPLLNLNLELVLGMILALLLQRGRITRTPTIYMGKAGPIFCNNEINYQNILLLRYSYACV